MPVPSSMSSLAYSCVLISSLFFLAPRKPCGRPSRDMFSGSELPSSLERLRPSALLSRPKTLPTIRSPGSLRLLTFFFLSPYKALATLVSTVSY